MKKQSIGDRDERFTQQVKVALPKHYVHKLDSLSCQMGIPRRYVIWDALGNFLLEFDRADKRS